MVTIVGCGRRIARRRSRVLVPARNPNLPGGVPAPPSRGLGAWLGGGAISPPWGGPPGAGDRPEGRHAVIQAAGHSAPSKRFDRHGLGDCYQANARRSAGWLCLVGQLLELCRPCLQELTQFNTAAHPALGDFQCHGRWY